MKITKEQQIDRNKLSELFRSRGHGIISPDILDILFQVLDGKLPHLSVFQCGCGELIVIPNDVAEIIAKRLEISIEDLPCKVCGGYRESTLDFTLVKAFDGLIDAVSKRTHRSADIDSEFLLRLLPSNNSAEFTVGLYELIQAINSHFPTRKSHFSKKILELGNAAKKRNKVEFTNYLSNILDFERMSIQMNNYLKAIGVVRTIKGERALKKLLGESINSDDPAEVHALHTAYLEAVEGAEHLKIMENLRRISAGQTALSDPFLSATLPPITSGARSRSIRSLSDIVEYLSLMLPDFKLQELYNTHIRNAKGHNEYKIDMKRKEIKLLKYGESIKILKLRRMTSKLTDLLLSMDEFIIKEMSKNLRTKDMLGITNMILGYDVPTVVGEQLVPIGDSPPALMIYQSWAFSQNNIFDNLDLKIRVCTKEVTISVARDISPIHWPLNDRTRRWLKQAVITGIISITVLSIAPSFPNFFLKAQFILPLGHTERYIYIQNIQEKKHTLQPNFIANISKQLNFDPASNEAKMMIEQSRRLGIIMKENLNGQVVRELIELRKQSFECLMIPLITSSIGTSSASIGEKEVFLDVPEEQFDNIKMRLYEVVNGFSTIRFKPTEGIVICLCEVRNLEDWKAILFPLYFSESILSDLIRQRNLNCYFKSPSGKAIGLVLSDVAWEMHK